MIVVVLVPVIAGMFFGVLMLLAACWRSALPKAPVVALALWPLWDFFGPGPVGPFSGDLLLLFSGVWLGVAVARLSRQGWWAKSADPRHAAAILHVWLRHLLRPATTPRIRRCVIAAGSALIGLTAVFIGPHDRCAVGRRALPADVRSAGRADCGSCPAQPVGWLMLFVGACFAANTVAVQYLAAGAGSGAEWWAWWVGRGGGASLVPATLLPVLLLPTGRLPKPKVASSCAGVVLGQLSLLRLRA